MGNEPAKKVTNEDIIKLRKQNQHILIAHKKVYHIPTDFLKDHPGGTFAITNANTKWNHDIDYDHHSFYGKKRWEQYCIRTYVSNKKH